MRNEHVADFKKGLPNNILFFSPVILALRGKTAGI